MFKKYGLLKPINDAHTLGTSNVEDILISCEAQVVSAPAEVCSALNRLSDTNEQDRLVDWIKKEKITELGFSYRLDPEDAVEMFDQLYDLLEKTGCFRESDRIHNLFFAGLPPACNVITEKYKGRVVCFYGDETPIETATKLGLPVYKLSDETVAGAEYDENRMTFAKNLLQSGAYESVSPPDRSGYPEFGAEKDRTLLRIDHSKTHGLPPLMRAHVGPYNSNRIEAIEEFLKWTKQLADARYLDILSVGTSQLTQERFGKDWEDLPNGGGVPINSESEFRAVWMAARPMLVRTYAGTTNIPKLAEMYEKNINTAWHALSFWWFCALDGRGPLSVKENIRAHFDTTKYIATTDKPMEPNVPHHFAFRGGDDITYVVSGVLAARAAAKMGIKTIVLQSMLNTPKATWGIQDLAKARVLLKIAKRIPGVRILLQPRAGLDYFSHDLNKAKTQLAAVTAMMDDIEPDNFSSPDIIHVVGFSEAVRLADPDVVNESIKITLSALEQYRKLKQNGEISKISASKEFQQRELELEAEVSVVLNAIERAVESPYSPQGFYDILRAGFLQIPYLWMCREEFADAVRWKTRILKGGVCVVDEDGKPVSVEERTAFAVENAMKNNVSKKRNL